MLVCRTGWAASLEEGNSMLLSPAGWAACVGESCRAAAPRAMIIAGTRHLAKREYSLDHRGFELDCSTCLIALISALDLNNNRLNYEH